MRKTTIAVVVLIFALGYGLGCRKNAADKNAFKTALNNYLAGHQECVWPAPIKLPAQADTPNDEQTRGFDALTDAGLLTRKPEEKKRFLIGSKEVNDYDLSDKGRSVWTADASQPGYGNFCYGHSVVTSIDGDTPAANTNATEYSVTYHDAVTQLADWANTAEMRTAFPKIASDTNGQETATATLTQTPDGWSVTNVRPATAEIPAQ
ncbi:MAG TPA: hypothetical protein VLZ50_12620 [Terracidiphilus sp.]|nr:hypothetical protein [Terracidiphilus sp.]